jgi:hypothetical protein
MFLAKVSFHFISLGQGYALPTELLPHSFILFLSFSYDFLLDVPCQG